MKVRARVSGWKAAQTENGSEAPDPSVPTLEDWPEYVEGELTTDKVASLLRPGWSYIRHEVDGVAVDPSSIEAVKAIWEPSVRKFKVWDPILLKEFDPALHPHGEHGLFVSTGSSAVHELKPGDTFKHPTTGETHTVVSTQHIGGGKVSVKTTEGLTHELPFNKKVAVGEKPAESTAPPKEMTGLKTPANMAAGDKYLSHGETTPKEVASVQPSPGHPNWTQVNLVGGGKDYLYNKTEYKLSSTPQTKEPTGTPKPSAVIHEPVSAAKPIEATPPPVSSKPLGNGGYGDNKPAHQLQVGDTFRHPTTGEEVKVGYKEHVGSKINVLPEGGGSKIELPFNKNLAVKDYSAPAKVPGAGKPVAAGKPIAGQMHAGAGATINGWDSAHHGSESSAEKALLGDGSREELKAQIATNIAAGMKSSTPDLVVATRDSQIQQLFGALGRSDLYIYKDSYGNYGSSSSDPHGKSQSVRLG